MRAVSAPFAGPLAAWPQPLACAEPAKWAEVDADALRRNAAGVVAHVGQRCAVMAMVKANGYGHGAVLAARAMLDGGARCLGVSSAEEALQLRAAGFEVPILLVGWTHPSTHDALVAAGVEVAVVAPVAVAELAAAAVRVRRPARLHLKVETGMGRLGVRVTAVQTILDEVAAHHENVELAGVFTHFADADGPDRNYTCEQHARFLAAVERVVAQHPRAIVHCSNSAATLRFAEFNHDMVRPGLVLYGYAPAHCEGVVKVEPALSVVSWVSHVFTARSGDTVGYNRTWRARRDTRVAVVAAGYGDGVQLAQSNRGHVLIHGALCPIVGRVSMDQLTADVSAAPDVAPGDRAVLLDRGDGGRRLGAAVVAAAAATSTYEVLCAISARVPRRVVGGDICARAGA